MTEQTTISFSRPEAHTLLVRLAGKWKIGEDLPQAEVLLNEITSGPNVERIAFDTRDLQGWDSGLLTFLTKVIDASSRSKIHLEKEGLPEGVQRLLALASAVPERKGARRETARVPFLARVGDSAMAFGRSTTDMLNFIGEAFIAVTRVLRGKARFRPCDLLLIIQDCGAQALPIVSLISVLVGLILAFIGAVQLMMFGAQIYVADLVGIAMVRVMGAVMAGIIMAGRTGAAFAAQLGTMQVNEEIDALETLGISPMEFLVLPRMLALALMMPLLCLYADFMGVLGGFIVGVTMLDLNVMEYYNQTRAAIHLNNLWIGLFQSAVFGVLVALAGCLRGMQCGRSASAVGDAATSAVVTGIVSIVVATAVITVLCNVLGI
ncbi:MAG: ABC transporter permease [Thermodesulfobacteriota bacterium]|nr:ABC transporter permease [Thermodesulfobacteriota bacterium]